MSSNATELVRARVLRQMTDGVEEALREVKDGELDDEDGWVTIEISVNVIGRLMKLVEEAKRLPHD